MEQHPCTHRQESESGETQKQLQKLSATLAFFQQAQQIRHKEVEPIVAALEEEWIATQHERN